MYEFFKLLSKSNIKINDLESFNTLYIKYIEEIETSVKTNISKLNKETYATFSNLI